MTHYVSARIKLSTANTVSLPNDQGFETGTYPNWARWVDEGSAAINTEGATAPAVGGEYTDRPRAVLDLSSALGFQLGKQLSQWQTYGVDYLGVTLENDDSGVNNDESLAASGRFFWYTPSHHRVKAMQLYRDVWNSHYEGGSTSTQMFSTSAGNSGDYKAIRYGLEKDTGDQVPYQSTDPFTDISGTKPNMYNIFQAYDNAQGTTFGSDLTNKVWVQGRTGYPDAIGWTATNKNGGSNGVAGQNDGFHMNGLDIPCMGGLLGFTIDSTQSDDLFTFNDEYHVRVTIGVSGWNGDF